MPSVDQARWKKWPTALLSWHLMLPASLLESTCQLMVAVMPCARDKTMYVQYPVQTWSYLVLSTPIQHSANITLLNLESVCVFELRKAAVTLPLMALKFK